MSSRVNPTKPWAFCSTVFGPITAPMTKLKMAATMIAIKKFCAFVSHSMPTAQITIIIAKATAPTIRISLTPPSTIFTPNDSAKCLHLNFLLLLENVISERDTYLANHLANYKNRLYS